MLRMFRKQVTVEEAGHTHKSFSCFQNQTFLPLVDQPVCWVGDWGVGEEKRRKGSEGFVRLSKLCFTKLPQCLSGFSPIHAFDKMAVMNYGGWEGIIWYCTSNCIDFMLQLCFERELFFFGGEMLKQFSFAVCNDCFYLELVTLAGVSQMSRGNLSLQDLSPPSPQTPWTFSKHSWFCVNF